MFQRYLILSLTLLFFSRGISALTQDQLDKAVRDNDEATISAASDSCLNWNKRLDRLQRAKDGTQENIQVSYLHMAVLNANPSMVEVLIAKDEFLVRAEDSYRRWPIEYLLDLLKGAPESKVLQEIAGILIPLSVKNGYRFPAGAEDIGPDSLRKYIAQYKLKKVFEDCVRGWVEGRVELLASLLPKNTIDTKSSVFDDKDFLDWASKKFVEEATLNEELFNSFPALLEKKHQTLFVNNGLCHAVIKRKIILAKRFIELGAAPLMPDRYNNTAIDYAFKATRVTAPISRTIYPESTINKDIITLVIAAIPENFRDVINLDDLVNYTILDLLSEKDHTSKAMIQEYADYKKCWEESIEYVVNNLKPNFNVEHLYVERFQEVFLNLIRNKRVKIEDLDPEILNEEIIVELRSRKVNSNEYGTYNHLTILEERGAIKIVKEDTELSVQLGSNVILMNDNEQNWPYVFHDNKYFICCSFINYIQALIAKFPSAFDKEQKKFDLTERNFYVLTVAASSK